MTRTVAQIKADASLRHLSPRRIMRGRYADGSTGHVAALVTEYWHHSTDDEVTTGECTSCDWSIAGPSATAVYNLTKGHAGTHSR